MASIESQILTRIKANLLTLTWVKTVNSDFVRISLDFQEHELPVIQIFETGTFYEHEQARVKATMDLTLELIMRTTVAGVASQTELLDKKYEVERKLGSDVQFTLPNSGVIHLRYVSSLNDLHSFEPFYLARMSVQAIYYKPFVREC